MNMHLTEDEQVEALKKWWRENGTAVIVGIVLGLSVVVGFWKWREYTETQAYKASDVYVEFTDALAEKNAATLNMHYATLTKDYSGTTYAVLAAMHMAKLAADKDNLDGAAKELQWALDHAGHDTFVHLARVRLANVLVAQSKADEALTLIQGLPKNTFDGQYAEIRGDVYRQKGNMADARLAYQSALDAGQLSGKRREFVQMKMNDLGKTITPAKTDQPDTK